MGVVVSNSYLTAVALVSASFDPLRCKRITSCISPNIIVEPDKADIA